jgi:hypothetical protein
MTTTMLAQTEFASAMLDRRDRLWRTIRLFVGAVRDRRCSGVPDR